MADHLGASLGSFFGEDDEHHDAECSRHTLIDFGFAHGSRKQGGAGAVTFTAEKGQSKKLPLPGRRDQGNRLRVTERGRPRSRRMTEREASSSSVHFVPNSGIVVSVSLLSHGRDVVITMLTEAPCSRHTE